MDDLSGILSDIRASLDSLGPIELGPSTRAAIILAGYAATGRHVGPEQVQYARELVKQLR